MIRSPQSRSSRCGFTLTELVVVMTIATILAAVAMAHINTRGFHVQGFADEAAATLRYAQKIAISQRRSVTVTIAGNQLALTYPGLGGAAVHKPPGINPFTVGPQDSNVTVTGASFTFDALGKPSAGGNITVGAPGETSVTIAVEAETGYVHVL